jgi:sigma-E factor negative regulatory protein RseC
MAKMMTHKAVVINVDQDGKATAEVTRPNACSSCGDKGSCHASDGSEIQLTFKNSGHLKPGDIIKIGIKKSKFYKSLTSVYVVPLLIMLVTAIVVSAITTNEIITASVTIISLVVYFLYLNFSNKGKERQSYEIIG